MFSKQAGYNILADSKAAHAAAATAETTSGIKDSFQQSVGNPFFDGAADDYAAGGYAAENSTLLQRAGYKPLSTNSTDVSKAQVSGNQALGGANISVDLQKSGLEGANAELGNIDQFYKQMSADIGAALKDISIETGEKLSGFMKSAAPSDLGNLASLVVPTELIEDALSFAKKGSPGVSTQKDVAQKIEARLKEGANSQEGTPAGFEKTSVASSNAPPPANANASGKPSYENVTTKDILEVMNNPKPDNTPEHQEVLADKAAFERAGDELAMIRNGQTGAGAVAENAIAAVDSGNSYALATKFTADDVGFAGWSVGETVETAGLQGGGGMSRDTTAEVKELFASSNPSLKIPELSPGDLNKMAQDNVHSTMAFS